MGVKGSKTSTETETRNSALSLLSEVEKRKLESVYRKINGSKPFHLLHWEKYLDNLLPENMTKCLFFLLGHGEEATSDSPVHYSTFESSILIILNESATNLAPIVVRLASDGGKVITINELYKLLGVLCDVYTEEVCNRDELRSWSGKLRIPNNDTFSRFLLKDFILPSKTKNCKIQEMANLPLPEMELNELNVVQWLNKTNLVSLLWSNIFRRKFPISDIECGFPTCTNSQPIAKTLFDPLAVLAINSHLPNDAKSEWHQVYNSCSDGESFSRLSNLLLNQGRTLIVIRDKLGHVFGAFASESWKTNPHFQGTNECFLFSIHPCLNVYLPTGYNDHYMYFNQNQQTLPNGLGFGGQLEYFGVWLASDFGQGHCSPSCLTYNCPQLSSTPDFQIHTLEVWRVGRDCDCDCARGEQENERETILDKDPGAEALLEMIGRSSVSKGFRPKDAGQFHFETS